jgi:hypothetical protein
MTSTKRKLLESEVSRMHANPIASLAAGDGESGPDFPSSMRSRARTPARERTLLAMKPSAS